MASNKTPASPVERVNNSWRLNRLALLLLILLIIVVGFFVTWFILKGPSHNNVPGEGTPVPKKHAIVASQYVSSSVAPLLFDQMQ